jgi:hypothetical protein
MICFANKLENTSMNEKKALKAVVLLNSRSQNLHKMLLFIFWNSNLKVLRVATALKRYKIVILRRLLKEKNIEEEC